jgi:thiol-disulfide isomerase/thioredoxin
MYYVYEFKNINIYNTYTMAYQYEGDRNYFLQLLKENRGVMIFKYTAEWCSPCQSIKREVDAHFQNISSESVLCFEVDVDENFDLFAYMKTKKMMKGIPTLMAYKKGSTSFVPDDSISGADIGEVNAFFERCRKM